MTDQNLGKKILEERKLEEIVPSFINLLKDGLAERNKKFGYDTTIFPVLNVALADVVFGLYDMLSIDESHRKILLGHLLIQYDSYNGDVAKEKRIIYNGRLSLEKKSPRIRLDWSKEKGRLDNYFDIAFP